MRSASPIFYLTKQFINVRSMLPSERLLFLWHFDNLVRKRFGWFDDRVLIFLENHLVALRDRKNGMEERLLLAFKNDRNRLFQIFRKDKIFFDEFSFADSLPFYIENESQEIVDLNKMNSHSTENVIADSKCSKAKWKPHLVSIMIYITLFNFEEISEFKTDQKLLSSYVNRLLDTLGYGLFSKSSNIKYTIQPTSRAGTYLNEVIEMRKKIEPNYDVVSLKNSIELNKERLSSYYNDYKLIAESL